MKTFYIFKLNEHYLSIAKENPYSIFVLLNSIYTYESSNVLVAFDLFSEICIPINKDFFNNYFYSKLKEHDEYSKFKNIHMYNNYLTSEISKMEVGNSHIKIKSNNNDNIFLLNLVEDMFVCDFKNNYYKIFNENKTKVIKR